jgi:hypothetical protein
MAIAKANIAISPKQIKIAQIRFNERTKTLFDRETRFGG